MNRQRFVALLLTSFIAGLAQASGSQTWHVGQVKKVDPVRQRLVLRHGELPEFDMPPMTMAYRVADAQWLESLRPEDEVEFQAAKVGGYYTLTELRRKPSGVAP